MTRGLVRNPFLGLLALAALNLFLLSVQIRSEDGRLLLRSWGLTVFTPFVYALEAAQDAAGVIAQRYRLISTVEERNRFLEEENWRLKSELSRLEALGRQVEVDAGFALLRERFEFNSVRAAVVWHNPPFFFEKIVINAGSHHGAAKDFAVLTPDGIVGRVRAVSAFSSEVELITDVNAAAGAQIGESGLQGVVTGTGTDELQLNFVLATARVNPGDIVVTSGTDGIYPKGVPVGTVVSADGSAGIYMSIRLAPFVDMRRLQEVAVVIGEP
jgi:rod shape-determining protein MreC